MIWIVISYLCGLYFGWKDLKFVVVIAISLFCLGLTFGTDYWGKDRDQEKLIYKEDRFLYALPIIIFLGFLIMKEELELPKIDSGFGEKSECIVTGKIHRMVENEWGMSIYLKENHIYLKASNLAKGNRHKVNSKDQIYNCDYLLVQSSDHNDYKVGNTIKVLGTIERIAQATNPGQFDLKSYYKSQRINYTIKSKNISITNSSYNKFQNILSAIKNNLMTTFRQLLDDKEAGVLFAMLLGEKQLLDKEIKELYQSNGISHLLAISGLHISLIGLTIYEFLKRLRLPIYLYTGISIGFILFYGFLTDFSVSTTRAIIMILAMLISKVLGRTYDLLSGVSLAAFIILIGNPLKIFQAGFLLSFGAVLGIAVLLPSFENLFRFKQILSNQILSGLLVSIATCLMTIPLVLSFFYQLPTYSILINVILVPCMSLLVIVALIAGIIGSFYLPIGVFLIGTSNYILKFYEWVSVKGSTLPGNEIVLGSPKISRIIVYYIFILIFVFINKRKKDFKTLAILLLAIIILVLPEKNPGLEICILDVGQGDGIFIRSQSGRTYFLDGGSHDVKSLGKNRIIPFIKYKGINRIDYAIISHADEDHINGIIEIMQETSIIKCLILPVTTMIDEPYVELENIAKENGVKLGYMKKGDKIRDGDLEMTCLHPHEGFMPLDRNSYSTTLNVRLNDFSMIFTGDLERDGERFLVNTLRESQNRKRSILKVAHHGSKFSTFDDFLELTSPSHSVISCGRTNPYGHPHDELIQRLEKANSHILITANSGAITIITDGNEMVVKPFIENDEK